MKKITLLLILTAISFCISAQETDEYQTPEQRMKKTSINAGVMMGGGSLIGADFEVLLTDRFAVQAGAGISSFGFGVNYHLKPRINSSFISVQYMQQGFGNYHYASYIAPTFNFRTRKIFQASLGLGYVVSKGPGIIDYMESKGRFDLYVTLMFSVGVYFPL
jgi:hypothetical protein